MTRSRWSGGPCLVALVLVALLLRLPLIDANLTDHDTWRQTQTASLARNFLDDPRILYPRVDWGAPGPGFVESEFPLVPYAVSLAYRVAGENALYGRLLALASVGVSCFFLARIARRLVGPGSEWVAVGAFVLSPLVFRYSRVFMPDATALCLTLVGVERFLAHLERRSTGALLTSACAVACAVLVKPTAVHIGGFLIFLLVAERGVRALFAPSMLAFAAISLLPAAAWFAHAAGLHERYGNTFGVLSGGDSKWGSPEQWLDPRFYLDLAFIEGAWILGPVGCLALALGVARFRGEPFWRPVGAWAAVLLLYYLAVGRYAGNPDIGLHYHLYAAPCVALALAGVWRALPRGSRSGRRVAAGMVAGLLVYDLALAYLIVSKPRHEHLIAAGRALTEATAEDDLVLVLSEDVELAGGRPNNFEQPDVFYHARRKGRSLPRDRQTGSELERRLVEPFEVFVNFPALNRHADASFTEFLESRTVRVASGESFEIYRVSPDLAEHGRE